MHGDVSKEDLKNENVNALKKGLVNLERHINNIRKFGLPVTVAINHFVTDSKAEVDAVLSFCTNSRSQGFYVYSLVRWW